jgi:hypothetical protein
MTTIKVRWTPRTIQTGQLEYWEPMKLKWVACTREMIKFWLSEGHSIHINPSF